MWPTPKPREHLHTRECLAHAIINAVENIRDSAPSDLDFRVSMQDGDALTVADDYLASGTVTCKCDEPRYTHDCLHCQYLGRFDATDLYFCDQGGGSPTVIARHSSEGSDYKSGLHHAIVDYHLAEAKRRAQAEGLLS